MVAGLFYLGSGIGLAAVMSIQRARRHAKEAARNDHIASAEIPWLAGAIAAGGVAGPALLMLGLTTTPAATASLLLNLEGVFTAVIAWVVFRENVDLSVFLGMVAIVAGGLLLSWQPGAGGMTTGALFVAAACACWAIDNNLTRKISAHDATMIACLKGLVAGSVNLAISLGSGAHLPEAATALAAMVTGFAGYGVSLALFVVALRHLGTARTGAYFSVAPLFGVALASSSGHRCRRGRSGPPPFSWGWASGCICASVTNMLTRMSRCSTAIVTGMTNITGTRTTSTGTATSRIPTHISTMRSPIRMRTTRISITGIRTEDGRLAQRRICVTCHTSAAGGIEKGRTRRPRNSIDGKKRYALAGRPVLTSSTAETASTSPFSSFAASSSKPARSSSLFFACTPADKQRCLSSAIFA